MLRPLARARARALARARARALPRASGSGSGSGSACASASGSGSGSGSGSACASASGSGSGSGSGSDSRSASASGAASGSGSACASASGSGSGSGSGPPALLPRALARVLVLARAPPALLPRARLALALAGLAGSACASASGSGSGSGSGSSRAAVSGAGSAVGSGGTTRVAASSTGSPSSVTVTPSAKWYSHPSYPSVICSCSCQPGSGAGASAVASSSAGRDQSVAFPLVALPGPVAGGESVSESWGAGVEVPGRATRESHPRMREVPFVGSVVSVVPASWVCSASQACRNTAMGSTGASKSRVRTRVRCGSGGRRPVPASCSSVGRVACGWFSKAAAITWTGSMPAANSRPGVFSSGIVSVMGLPPWISDRVRPLQVQRHATDQGTAGDFPARHGGEARGRPPGW